MSSQAELIESTLTIVKMTILSSLFVLKPDGRRKMLDGLLEIFETVKVASEQEKLKS